MVVENLISKEDGKVILPSRETGLVGLVDKGFATLVNEWDIWRGASWPDVTGISG